LSLFFVILCKMAKLEIDPELLHGFECGNTAAVTDKLASFALAGSESFHVVSDFDLTLTAGKQPGQNIGTWDVMDELLPPEGVERHAAIYNSFRPTEVQGRLSAEIAREKWSETLDLITSYPINIDDVETAFLSVAQLRQGARELFDICEAGGVPTVILSSGIRNVIQTMAEHYQIHPTYILSNDLEFDEATRLVTGWRRNSLVHMLNKNEMGHSELASLRMTRPNVLLLGDVPDDVRMVEGDNVLRIRILDPRKGEIHNLEIAKQVSFERGYDLVVEHDLRPVVHIAKWLTSLTVVENRTLA
jgi:HAD superfamily phosphoserine phosphatase-like hydrolase